MIWLVFTSETFPEASSARDYSYRKHEKLKPAFFEPASTIMAYKIIFQIVKIHINLSSFII